MADQTIQFSMQFGVDGKKDPRIQQLGTLRTAKNVVYDKLGAANKRPGNLALGVATAPASSVMIGQTQTLPATIPAPVNGGGMFALGAEQVVASGNRIYSYSPTLGKHTSKDEIPEAVGTRRSLSSNSANYQYFGSTCAQTTDGYRVYAWLTDPASGSVYVRIFDATTGAVVYSLATPISSAVSSAVLGIQLVACGTHVALIYAFSGYIAAVLLLPSAATTGGLVVNTQLVALANTTNGSFDACANAAGTTVYVTWIGTTSSVLYLAAFPVASWVSYTTTFLGLSGTIGAIALCDNAGTLVVAALFPSTKAFVIYAMADTSLGTILWATTMPAFQNYLGASQLPSRIALSPYTSTVTLLSVDGLTSSGGVTNTGFACAGFNSSGAVSTVRSQQGAGLYGYSSTLLYLGCKPVAYQGRMYALLYMSSTTQGTWFWCDLEVLQSSASQSALNAPRLVATVAPRLMPSLVMATTVPTCVAMGASLFAGCSVVEGAGNQARGPTGSVVAQNKLWETQLNFASPGRYLAGRLGRSAVVGSSVYDGAGLNELGFANYPEVLGGAGASGGGMTASSTYIYVILYEWTSSTAETVRSTFCQSPTSQVKSVPLFAGQTAVTLVNICPPVLSAKQDAENGYATPASIGVYRSQANGTTLNFVTSLPLGTTTYTDTASDTAIAGNPQLYFTPGFPGTTLDYICPPSSSCTFVAQGRQWILGDDLQTWYFSNAYQDGYQCTFNEALSLSIQDGDSQLAGGPLDDKIIFFTANAIYYTNGSGPNPTGGGDFYPTPARIQSDVGCVDPRSVVTVPDGLMFISQKGLTLLGRDLSVNYLDAPLAQLASYPNVTSAVLVANRNEVRFALNNGTNGIDLVCNYFSPSAAFAYRWSWFEKYDAGAGVPSCMSFGATMCGNSYRWLAASGYPYQEDTAGVTYLDGGTAAANWVQFRLETSDISPTGPVTFHRAKRFALVGDFYTSHDLYLGSDTNNNGAYAAPTGHLGFVPSDISDGVTLEAAYSDLANQKCQSFRLMVYDAPPSAPGDVIGSGRGLSVAAFAVTIMPKQGLGKLAGAARGV